MVVIELGYQKYVLSAEDALTLVKVLEKAERYEGKYIPAADRAEYGGADYLHYVFPNDKGFTFSTLSDDVYRMAKLAGRPPEK